MTTLREAAQMALEALEKIQNHPKSFWHCSEEIEALRAALAQPEPDYRIRYDRPCYKCRNNYCPGNCDYTTPPQREWQGLTDDEIERLFVWQEWSEDFADYEPVARAIEAKLREKNSI